MDNNQKTLVIGASEKPDRYSNMAIRLLLKNGKQVVAIGSRTGQVEGVFIQEGLPNFEYIHTITLYINPSIQKKYYEYILALHPKRIIFNPGTENHELKEMAEAAGIKSEEACTLVLLNLNLY